MSDGQWIERGTLDEWEDRMRDQIARIAALEAERDEARRRRDEWRKKAEGYDEVRRALRQKVGTPWPPNMSRLLWAGIAADEKKRADDAEADNAKLREALRKISEMPGRRWQRLAARAALAETEDQTND